MPLHGTATCSLGVIDRPTIKMISAALLVTSFPGPQHLHPTVHYARGLVSQQGGWHDIAGAITSKGVHHIFQGTGWNHAFSSDLVHWKAQLVCRRR